MQCDDCFESYETTACLVDDNAEMYLCDPCIKDLRKYVTVEPMDVQ